MKRPSIAFLITLGLIAIVAFAAYSAIPTPPFVSPQNSADSDLAGSIANAKYIVLGTVADPQELSRRIGNEDMSFQAFTLKLSRVIRGKLFLRRSLVVWIDTRFVGSPRLEQDQEVVLFLVRSDADGLSYLTPFGGSRGIRICGQDHCRATIDNIESLLTG